MKTAHIDIETGETTETDWTAEEVAAWTAEMTAGAWNDLRAERNRRLADCDWTQVADSPVDKYAWAEYRQQLRDLPANTTDPTAPVWPTAPA